MENIVVDNFVSFSDDEITSNGKGSTKALHITTDYKEHILPKVLIEKGSTLNVMPLLTLAKLPINMSYIKRNHTTVRAFNGTHWEVSRNIKMPLRIGPCNYDIEFQVMDITSFYNFLIRRPWIHLVRQFHHPYIRSSSHH